MLYGAFPGVLVDFGRKPEREVTMQDARPIGTRTLVAVLATILAAAAIWATIAAARGGSPGPATPAPAKLGDAGGSPTFLPTAERAQEGQRGDRDCPFKDDTADAVSAV
jgi:hypothetical protein